MSEKLEQEQVTDIGINANQSTNKEDEYSDLSPDSLTNEDKQLFKMLLSVIIECADLAVSNLEKRSELKRLEELFGSVLITADTEITQALKQCGIDI